MNKSLQKPARGTYMTPVAETETLSPDSVLCVSYGLPDLEEGTFNFDWE